VIKVGSPPADLDRVGDSEKSQQLANSMFGALLAVVHQIGGDAAVTEVLARSGELRSAADLRRPDGWSS